MPFDILIYLFSDLFFLPAMEVLPSYSGCCRRETGFSSSIPHSCGSWELTHCSLFFLRGEVITDYFIPMLCHLQEGAPLAKFLLPSSMCPVLFFFFFSNGKLDSLLGKAGLLQSLSHLWLSSQVSPLLLFPCWDWEGLWPVSKLLLVPQPLPSSVCLTSDAWVGGWDSAWVSWCMVLNPVTPTEVLLFMDGFRIHCLKAGTKGGLSYAAMMLMSLQHSCFL